MYSPRASGFRAVAIALIAFGLPIVASAAQIVLGGSITQSTLDGTGPAVNNPFLNSIFDFQAHTETLVFAGTIAGPGNYSLTSLIFSDASASAGESAFGAMTLSVAANGAVYEFSLLGCLTSGSGCAFGNQLTLNFSIPAAGLNGQSVTATGLDQPHPLDLLEDDGTTDIQGTITSYSYTGQASPVPEPSTAVFLLLACGAFALRKRT